MRRSLLLVCWLLMDALLFCAAYVAAYFLRVGFVLSTDFPLDNFMQATLMTLPLWLATLVTLNVFALGRRQGSLKTMLYIAFACAMALSFFTLTYYFLFNNFFSRLLLVYAGILSFAITMLWHIVYDTWQRKVLRRDPPAYPVLIIGSNRDAERIIRLLNEKQSPLKPVGILGSHSVPVREIASVPVLGRLHKLESTMKELRITHLIQCDELEHTINLLSACRTHRITYFLLPSVLGIVGMNERSEHIEGQPVIAVS